MAEVVAPANSGSPESSIGKSEQPEVAAVATSVVVTAPTSTPPAPAAVASPTAQGKRTVRLHVAAGVAPLAASVTPAPSSATGAGGSASSSLETAGTASSSSSAAATANTSPAPASTLSGAAASSLSVSATTSATSSSSSSSATSSSPTPVVESKDNNNTIRTVSSLSLSTSASASATATRPTTVVEEKRPPGVSASNDGILLDTIVKEGVLYFRIDKTFVESYVLLRNWAVEIYSGNTSPSGRNVDPIQILNLIGTVTDFVDEKPAAANAKPTPCPYVFTVVPTQGKRPPSLTFATITPEDRVAWVAHFRRLKRFDVGGLPPQLHLTGNEWVDTDLQQSAQTTVQYVHGSTDHNTKKGSFIKSKVSKKKRRFCADGFDLDLTYITGRIIAMGFPSVGREALYRNDMKEVVRFFETRHPGHYKVYNLCSERVYDRKAFPYILHFPFDDHNPPAFEDILFCIRDILDWLRQDPANVCGIHCKAGKGRTGLIISILLLYIGMWPSANEALRYYGFVRTKNQKGVTIPSQIRWVYMFQDYLTISRNFHKIPITGQPALTQAPSSSASASMASAMTSPSTVAEEGKGSSSFSSSSSISSSTATSPVPASPILDVNSPPLDRAESTGKPPSTPSSKSSDEDDSDEDEDEDDDDEAAAAGAAASSGTPQGSSGNASPGPSPTVGAGAVVSSAPSGAQTASLAAAAATSLPPLTTKHITMIKVSASAPKYDAFVVTCAGNDVAMKSKDRPGVKITKDKTGTTYTMSEGVFPVLADFNVEFYKGKLFGGQYSPFSFWLHTQFTGFQNDHLILHRRDLDTANKKKGADFTVEIVLSSPSSSSSSSSSSAPSPASPDTSPATQPGSF